MKGKDEKVMFQRFFKGEGKGRGGEGREGNAGINESISILPNWRDEEGKDFWISLTHMSIPKLPPHQNFYKTRFSHNPHVLHICSFFGANTILPPSTI